MTPEGYDKVQIVYRCKDDAERVRRVQRAEKLCGTPFIRLPGEPPQHKILFVSGTGDKVRVEHIEMVFNDALLMDAISNWGEDGPLYGDTLDGDPPNMREAYEYALKAYAGVELPPQLRNPRSQ
jgi:hypothetical protein